MPTVYNTTHLKIYKEKKRAEIGREEMSRGGFPGNETNLFILDQPIKLDFSTQIRSW